MIIKHAEPELDYQCGGFSVGLLFDKVFGELDSSEL